MDNNGFLDFCEKSGFIIDEYQRKIVKEIFNDIENETLISLVLMPNAAGKTNLSLLLSWYFKSKGFNSLLYSPMGMKYDYSYTKLVKDNVEYIEQMDFANAGDIRTKMANKYSYIVADGLAYTDINNVKADDVFAFIQQLISYGPDEIGKARLREDYLEWMGQRYLSKITVASKAKVIIFMRREDLKACKQTIFCLSTKKNIIDIYPHNKKEAIKAFQIESVEPNFKDVENDFCKQFYDKLEQIEGKVDEVNKKVSAVYNIIQNVQKQVEVQKQVIAMCSDFMNEDCIDTLVEKTLNKLSKQMEEEVLKLEKFDAFKKYECLVKIRMGDEAWNKLENESKRFLVTAKFTFAQNIIFGGPDIDYSSICLLTSKAFEIELSKRLVVKYVEFLEEEIGNDYNKWPSAITKYDNDIKDLRPLKMDEFVLGNCPYLFGILESKKKDKICNRTYFEKYCRTRLMKKVKTKDLQDVIRSLDTNIKTIKDKFRNPAAHKDSISMEEASYCIDYILEIERVLKSILELFMY